MPHPHSFENPGPEITAALSDALREKIVGFSALARAAGLKGGLGVSQDACRVAALFLIEDFAAFRDAMRSLMCLSQEQLPIFDRLFQGYWCPADATEMLQPPSRRLVERTQAGTLHELTLAQADAERASEETSALAGASDVDLSGRTDLTPAAEAELAEMERLARRLWERMRIPLPRRLAGWMRRRHLHMRRTWRRNLCHGGELLHLVLSGKSPRKPRLVLLLDVSGSMENHSLSLLRLVHALQRRFRNVSSFAFNTRLVELTPALRAKRWDAALRAMSSLSLGWNGGTRIGECLGLFARHHAGRLLRRDTVFVVLSDGLDTGDPELLGDHMRSFHARVQRIVWLNPLLSIEGYEPLARGMAAALPFVDVFAPVYDSTLPGLERRIAD